MRDDQRHHGATAAYLPAEHARTIFGDPRAVTGGFAMPSGTGTPVEGGLRATGRWAWDSGVHHCTWIGGGAVAEGTGTPFVLFAPDQVEVHGTRHVAGLRGTRSTDYEVRDAFVP